MLYRILRDLGSMDSAKRQAAIRMARGLPWEDLEQFLSFYDRGQADGRRNALTLLLILIVVGLGTVSVFHKELDPHGLFVAAMCIAAVLPMPIAFIQFGGRKRVERGLSSILEEIDDAAFVAVGLGILSEKHADDFSFRPDLLKAVARLLPEVTVERCRDWTPEERYALSHGLHTVLPVSAGGRDALSTSPHDFAIFILKVLQRIGDGREIDLVRLVSTIDPITEQHQKVREASVKCLKSIENRTVNGPSADAPITSREVPAAPVTARANRLEADVSHLLKKRVHPRTTQPGQTE